MNPEYDSIRVLVVDDDERFRNNAVKLLRSQGFSADAAAGGAESLTCVEEEEFDVIILDQKMPGLSGLETLQCLRERNCSAEVVILTGFASEKDAQTGMQLGAVDYILKPVASEVIADKIVAAYERKLEKLRNKEC